MIDIDGLPIKPWPQMTPDEKTALAMETIYQLGRRQPPEGASTTNPGPMPLRCQMYLQRMYATREEQG